MLRVILHIFVAQPVVVEQERTQIMLYDLLTQYRYHIALW